MLDGNCKNKKREMGHAKSDWGGGNSSKRYDAIQDLRR